METQHNKVLAGLGSKLYYSCHLDIKQYNEVLPAAAVNIDKTTMQLSKQCLFKSLKELTVF